MNASNPRPVVVAVGGIPGSGKTTLARRLGEVLHVPVVCRDAIKEGLHVTRRSVDPAEVRRFSELAFDLFYAVVDELVDAGVSVIIEAAFHHEFARARFAALAARADLVALWCEVPSDVARQRYRARAERGERHPAHADLVYADAMDRGDVDWSGYDPPAGSWPVITVDTSGDPQPSIAELVHMIDACRAR